jgi:hypothetical protein
MGRPINQPMLHALPDDARLDQWGGGSRSRLGDFLATIRTAEPSTPGRSFAPLRLTGGQRRRRGPAATPPRGHWRGAQDPPDQHPADTEDLPQRFLAEFGAGRQPLLDDGVVDLGVDDVGSVGHARREVRSAANRRADDSRCRVRCIEKCIALCTEVRFHLSTERRAGDGAVRHNQLHALQPRTGV